MKGISKLFNKDDDLVAEKVPLVSAAVVESTSAPAASAAPLPSFTALNVADSAVGKYQVHVHILEARDLKTKDGDSGACNPLVEVRLTPFDLQQATRMKTSTFNARFNESLFFNVDVHDPRELDCGRIVMKVINYGKVFTTTIGTFQYGIADIYAKPDHEVYRQWIALADSTDSVGVQGYLKVSVTVLGPNDQKAAHPLEGDDDNAEKDAEGWEVIKNCEYPRAMKLKTWGVKVNVFSAQHLPRSDAMTMYKHNFGDPFLTLAFGDGLVRPQGRSPTAPQTQNPEWPEGTHVFARAALPDGVLSTKIEIAMNDERLGNRTNERIATSFFALQDLLRERRWLLTADRALSNFFHPRSAAKKRALREKERLKNKDQSKEEVDIVLQVGMELKHRELHTYVRIVALDPEKRKIFAVEEESTATSAAKAAAVAAKIEKFAAPVVLQESTIEQEKEDAKLAFYKAAALDSSGSHLPAVLLTNESEAKVLMTSSSDVPMTIEQYNNQGKESHLGSAQSAAEYSARLNQSKAEADAEQKRKKEQNKIVLGNIGTKVVISKTDYKSWWLVPPLQYAKPFWVNLYGAPAVDELPNEFDNDVVNRMNSARIDGTRYRGRALISMHLFESESQQGANQRAGSSEDTEKDVGVHDAKYYELKHAQLLLPAPGLKPPEAPFKIVIKPWESSMLHGAPSLLDKVMGKLGSAELVQIVVQIGPYVMESKPAEIVKGRAVWDKSYMHGVFSLPADPHQMPDMFVYLKRTSGPRKGKSLSYLRLNMRNTFLSLDVHEVTKIEPKWYQLKEDKAVHLIPFGEFPGQLQFGIAFGPESANSWTATTRDLLAVPTFKRRSYYFWMHVFEACDLVSPSADPYVFVSCGNCDATSLPKFATTNPSWNQSIGFRVDDFPEPTYLERAPPIFVTVLDNKDNKALGHFWYSAQQAFEDADAFQRHGESAFSVRRHQLWRAEGKTGQAGHIVAAFQLFVIDEEPNAGKNASSLDLSAIVAAASPVVVVGSKNKAAADSKPAVQDSAIVPVVSPVSVPAASNYVHLNADPAAMKRDQFDGFARLHPVLVPAEYHPAAHTVQIEILGLRDMQTSLLLGLLALRRPKITFEIGGVRSVLDIAPSFASNGNFNFAEEFLPVLTIESKLLRGDLFRPSINVLVVEALLNANSLVGRGTIPLIEEWFGDDNLEDADEGVSMSSITTEHTIISSVYSASSAALSARSVRSAAKSIGSFGGYAMLEKQQREAVPGGDEFYDDELLRDEQNLDGFDVDEDEPLMSADSHHSHHHHHHHHPRESMQSRSAAKGDQFFGSRDAQKRQLLVDSSEINATELLSLPAEIKIDGSSPSAYVPLRDRSAVEEPVNPSGKVDFIPLRQRNAAAAISVADQVAIDVDSDMVDLRLLPTRERRSTQPLEPVAAASSSAEWWNHDDPIRSLPEASVPAPADDVPAWVYDTSIMPGSEPSVNPAPIVPAAIEVASVEAVVSEPVEPRQRSIEPVAAVPGRGINFADRPTRMNTFAPGVSADPLRAPGAVPIDLRSAGVLPPPVVLPKRGGDSKPPMGDEQKEEPREIVPSVAPAPAAVSAAVNSSVIVVGSNSIVVSNSNPISNVGSAQVVGPIKPQMSQSFQHWLEQNRRARIGVVAPKTPIDQTKKILEIEPDLDPTMRVKAPTALITASAYASGATDKSLADADDDVELARWYVRHRPQVDGALEEIEMLVVEPPLPLPNIRPSTASERLLVQMEMIVEQWLAPMRLRERAAADDDSDEDIKKPAAVEQKPKRVARMAFASRYGQRSEIKIMDDYSLHYDGEWRVELLQIYRPPQSTASTSKPAGKFASQNGVSDNASTRYSVAHSSISKSASKHVSHTPAAAAAANAAAAAAASAAPPAEPAKQGVWLIIEATVPTTTDPAAQCLLSGRCTVCGSPASIRCGCIAPFPFPHPRHPRERVTFTLLRAAEPLGLHMKATCHHPQCWLQRAGIRQMMRPLRWHAPPPDSLDELEFSYVRQAALPTPFASVSLQRGAIPLLQTVGTLKTRVRVLPGWQRYDIARRQSSNLMLNRTLAQSSGKNMSSDISRTQTYVVRLYVLRAIDLLHSAAFNAASSTSSVAMSSAVTHSLNPYLVIRLGSETINTNKSGDAPVYANRPRSHRAVTWGCSQQTANPDFSRYGCLEFTATIPGDSQLHISAWSAAAVYSRDEEIGTTVVDLEDRLFSAEWRNRHPVPIERRTLRHSVNQAPRGKLEMWVEVYPEGKANAVPVLDIVPPPPSLWELRVIVYEIDGIKSTSQALDCSDLYVRCAVEGGEWKETDVHMRARDGRGSFNWRMKFPLELPLSSSLSERLKIQVWDKDLLEADDAIAEGYLDLQPVFRQALRTQRRVVLINDWKTKEPEQMSWIDLKHPNSPHSQGRLRFSAELLPAKQAEAMDNGSGQAPPNKFPFLTPPDGRPEWNWMNPIGMLVTILGPAMFARLQRYICVPVIGIPLFIALGYLLNLLLTSFPPG